MTRMRVFDAERDAEQHLATLPVDAIYLERTEGVNPRPGRAAARLAAKGVLTEQPVDVVPLKDGRFAVPVPLVVETIREKDARGVDYDRVAKRAGTDALAVDVAHEDVVRGAKGDGAGPIGGGRT